MFIRHSLKNIFRSWKKSILFLSLIIILVMILCIGVSLTVTINDFLKNCEEKFTTIATFEYMGAAYPNEAVYDPNLDMNYDTFNSAGIASNPYVKQWDSNAAALGYIGTLSGLNALAPYKNDAVLVVHINGYKDYESVYSGEISEILYSYNDEQDHMAYINTMGKELEIGHYYLLHGQFYLGHTSYRYVSLAPYINAAAESAGFDGTIDKMIVDITTPEGGYKIPSDSYFHDIANTYAVINNSITVHATNNLEALLPFQQGTLYLIDGRGFTEQDYSTGAPVCIISDDLAKSLNVKIGGQINLSLATQSGSVMYESYWAGKGFAYTGKYNVVGLINTQRELKNDIFIPKSDAVDLSVNHFQYTLGQAELYNDKADQFISEITPLLSDRIRMTVYDQGYASVAKPLKDVLRGAVLVTCVCAIVCLAVAFLFGFLFVYKQRDAAKNMRRLGAGERSIFSYFLFGSGFISLTSVIIGTVISIEMSGWFMEFVRKLAAGYAADDLRYSNGNLSMVKAIEFAPKIRTDILLFTGFIVFLLTVSSCCLFAGLCINPHNHKHKVSPARDGAVSCSLHGGPFKYAWISIKRGYSRTYIPILVSICVIILLLQLTYVTVNYNAKLEELNKSTEIKGYFTDIYGKQTSGLNVDGIAVHSLASSGYLADISVTKDQFYYYLGRSIVNGQPVELPEFEFPATEFAFETFTYNLSHGSNIVYTNDLSSVPEFYFSSNIITNFSDGYDASIFKQEVPEFHFDLNIVPNSFNGHGASTFSQEAGGSNCCIVSTAFMEENGINLGDTISVLTFDGKDFSERAMLVAGSFVKAGKADNIYCQLGAYISPKALLEGETGDSILNGCTFSSVHFKLAGSENLSSLKDYLCGKGYSEVKKIRSVRSFITIDDKIFLTTKSAMTQRIWYMDRIFPALYILIELLAGLIPYILIQQRRREIAIMRGQGTSRRIAFFNMFIEQAMLNVTGVILGILLSMLLYLKYSSLGFVLTGIFTFCWLVGTFISVHQINHCSVQSILKAEE